MRGFCLKRGQRLLHELNEKQPKLKVLRENVDNIGAQLEEDMNKQAIVQQAVRHPSLARPS